jgi:uridine kinase
MTRHASQPRDALRMIDAVLECKSRARCRLILGIDGYPGIGKTTFASALAAQRRDATTINLDDFLVQSGKVCSLLRQRDVSAERLAEGLHRTQTVTKLVSAFRRSRRSFRYLAYSPSTGRCDRPRRIRLLKPLLIAEGVFSLHPRGLHGLWDIKVFLKGRYARADKRYRRRARLAWGSDIPRSSPRSAIGVLRTAYKRYVRDARPDQHADIVVDVDGDIVDARPLHAGTRARARRKLRRNDRR